MIFAGPTITMLSLLSTVFVFYLVATLSIPSIRHLDDRSTLIRSLSVVALIMNVFWVIPWVLLIWDAFGSFDYYTCDTIWRLLWTAADIAIFCTVIAGQLVKIRWSSRLKKFFQCLLMVCAGFIAFDALIMIWYSVFDDGELLFKFICAEIILVVLQIIVTQLLSQKMRQEEARKRILNDARLKRDSQQKVSTLVGEPKAQPSSDDTKDETSKDDGSDTAKLA